MIKINNKNLQKLLIQYEQKRNEETKKAELRKKQIYKEIPELEKIDDKISKISISAMKMIMISPDKNIYTNLQNQLNVLKQKKVDLLENAGKSIDDFSPKYECNKCKDTGYITTESGSFMCSCLQQKLYNLEYDNSNIYNLKQQNFDNFNLSFYSDKPDEKKYNSSISPRENIKLIRNICDEFIDNFDSPSQHNLLFSGNTGLGKSFLSSCIANEMIKKGKTVLYQTAPGMLDNIIDYRFGKNSQEQTISKIQDVDLLIIDDLGTECINSMKFTELFNILNTRLLNQNNKITKTIISTNLNLQELFKLYDERIVSRIIGNYDICYFFGEDIRFIKKKICK